MVLIGFLHFIIEVIDRDFFLFVHYFHNLKLFFSFIFDSLEYKWV